jgi:hypothetical protein
MQCAFSNPFLTRISRLLSKLEMSKPLQQVFLSYCTWNRPRIALHLHRTLEAGSRLQCFSKSVVKTFFRNETQKSRPLRYDTVGAIDLCQKSHISTTLRYDGEVGTVLFAGNKNKNDPSHANPIPLEALSVNVSEGDAALRNLKGLLLINDGKARKILKRYPRFREISLRTVSITVDYLVSQNVPLSRALNHPWLLLMEPS